MSDSNIAIAHPEARESRRSYHALARSLEAGTPTRPGLPIELVIPILRMAHCIVPSPVEFSSTSNCQARAMSHEPVVIPWMSTPPLQRKDIARLASMQLRTFSRDQGWCNDEAAGSWSWFEIAISSAENIVKQKPDGNDLVWLSHRNPIASQELDWRIGDMFGPDHEVWEYLEEGDMLVVRVCAQFGAWQNIAQNGHLQFMEWFEPTLPPRKVRDERFHQMK
ncbi:hypothetical protein BU17DRAFT_80686 [Hysterangium stoloniferum]|nr:hypothetical protein BU17DRAFT_80686 [Hysterangium stoloniferum]